MKALFEIVGTCKGGGYMYARTIPVHPKANENGLYPLHRVLMENKLGKLLVDDEVVHHRNGVKSDNRVENLEVMKRAEHSKLHKPGSDFLNLSCGNCQKSFSLKPHQYRLRSKRTKSKEVFCSRSCGALKQHRVLECH